MFIKKVLYILFVALTVTSCASRKGGFDNLEVAQFNKNISQRVDIASTGELAEIFYNWSTHKPNPVLETTIKESNGIYEVTLIHLGIPDSGDIKDVRLELKAKRDMQVWTVLEARKSWKCKSGKGKDNWSNKECK